MSKNLDFILDNHQQGFTFPATAVADGIINLHNHIFYTSILITIFITYIVIWIIIDFYIDTKIETILLDDIFDEIQEVKDFINANLYNRFFLLRNFKHDMELEVAWTLVPCVILLFIALPSFSFLYTIERIPFVALFFKAIGHQWYWSYEIGPYQAYFFFNKILTEKALFLNNLLAKLKLLKLDGDAFSYLSYLNKDSYDESKVFLDLTGKKKLFDLKYWQTWTTWFLQKPSFINNKLNDIEENYINIFSCFDSNSLLSGGSLNWYNADLFNYILNKNGIVKKALVFYFCDSYMINRDDLLIYEPNYFTVDNPLVLPYNAFVGLMTSSVDVIHSFAVPEFGVKLDAIPGRVNQFSFLIDRSGVFYGQCSELCGVGHAFMPITVYSVNKTLYFEVMQNLVEKNIFSASYVTDSLVNAQESLSGFFLPFNETEDNLFAEYMYFTPKNSFFSIYISPTHPYFQI